MSHDTTPHPGSADAPDPDRESTDVPNPDTGVGVGAGEPSMFEPEEDPSSVPDDPEAYDPSI